MKKSIIIKRVSNRIDNSDVRYTYSFSLPLTVKVKTNHSLINRILLTVLHPFIIKEPRNIDLEIAIPSFLPQDKIPISVSKKLTYFFKKYFALNKNSFFLLKDIKDDIFLVVGENYYFLCDYSIGRACYFINAKILKEGRIICRSLLFQLPYIFCIAARLKSLICLHAAILSMNGSILLLPGKSGSGKTTLSLNSTASGFKVFHDDTCYLFKSNNSVYGQIIRLVEMELKNNRYLRVFLSRQNAMKVSVDKSLCFTPNKIIFPQVEKIKKSYLLPIPKNKALLKIIPLIGFEERTQGNFKIRIDILKSLIKQCDCYLLRCGYDIKHSPRRLYKMLSPVIEKKK